MRVKAIALVMLCAGLAFCASSQTKVQRAREKDPKYQYNLGLFYLNQSDTDNAVKYFIKSLTLDTRYYPAWNALGLAHSMRGRLDESAKAYQKCLEINPRFTEAHNNLGTVYQGMNQLDKAEEEFRKALADLTYQNRELPYCNLARLYVIQDRLDEALENADKALSLWMGWVGYLSSAILRLGGYSVVKVAWGLSLAEGVRETAWVVWSEYGFSCHGARLDPGFDA